MGLNYKNYIKIDHSLLRPSKTVTLRANTNKAKSKLNFRAKTNVKKLIQIMMDHELAKFKSKQCDILVVTDVAARGIDVKNIWPADKIWEGGLNNYTTGGGVKLNLLREYINDLPGEDLIVFTDAYDVFFASNLDEIIRRYLCFKTEVLFQAESCNWPDPNLIWTLKMM